jgi:hypothetical protein
MSCGNSSRQHFGQRVQEEDQHSADLRLVGIEQLVKAQVAAVAQLLDACS